MGHAIVRLCFFGAKLVRVTTACGLLLALLLARTLPAAEVVAFPSGDKQLHGLLYKPPGSGPFPAVLFNHGSASGMLNNQAFELIAPLFTRRGWAFFAPYRRGQGLSADAGQYIGNEISAAKEKGGLQLGAETMVRLLTTEQLQDQLAALAWLRQQPLVRPKQIAAVGNSFGGIESLLGAEQPGYCAVVDASGGAESWQIAPELHTVMLDAGAHARVPVLFFQAQNDYTLEPSYVLYDAMHRAGKPAAIRIYPPYGSSPAEGHSFSWRGALIWAPDVLEFLAKSCGA